MPKFQAAAYLRLSYTENRENESDSIANQKKLIEDYVKGRPDIELVSEKVDDGYSGILFDRPAFQEMMQDITEGRVNCVIVKDLSRLGREYIETGRYLRRIFPAYGVRFIAINDNIDTAHEHAGDDLSISMKNIINDAYCHDISVKTRSALAVKRRNGDYVGACPVYGYRKSEENRNRLVVDEYAARVVRDIFRARIDGRSAKKIADELNALGVLSPLAYKVNRGLPHPTGGFADRKDAKWSATTVIRILQDEIYTGTLVQGRRGTVNHKIKDVVKRPAEEWVRVENAHDPIIRKADFDLVQSIMKLDTRTTSYGDMEAHLASYPEIEIAGIYTDNGISGRTFEREAFQRMLADIEAGKINCVVVKDLSRLGRNTIDTGYYIEKYFPIHQVRFLAINDQFDSLSADNSGSHITVPLKNMINEAYAADISKKVRSQAHQSMRAGEFIGGRPPYGYRKNPDNCHKLLPDENTAPVVRRIFAWAAEGVPLNQIVKRLNEAGILTPSRYKASCGLIQHESLIGSGAWQTMTVSKILSDEVYTGDMVQGKTTVIGHKQIPAPREDWVIVRGTHEPLVCREVFEKARSAREQAARKYTPSEKNPYSKNILRGRIFCGCCGSPLHRERHRCPG